MLLFFSFYLLDVLGGSRPPQYLAAQAGSAFPASQVFRDPEMGLNSERPTLGYASLVSTSCTPPTKQNRDSNENYAVVGAGGSAKCYLCGEEGHLATLCPKGQADVSNAKVTPVEGGGKIVDVEGDLMTAPDSLCHCVSQCLAMGKGVAVLFKQKFGGVDELKAQKVVVPGVATLHRPTEADSNKYVYYLITKPRYFDKPTYDTLAASLEAMFAHMEAHEVKSVSMPEIGCGLDGLQWPKVHEMLIALSQGRGITVTVYHFKPAKQMWSKKGKYA